MSTTKFLRLSHNLVNTRYIKNVEIHPSAYKIVLYSSSHDATIFFLLGILKSVSHEFNVSKENNLADYEVVSKWVEEMSK